MATAPFTPDRILTLLADAPPRIVAATAGVSPAELRAAPAPGEWSAVEVLAHLRACADVWGEAIRTILAENGPTIRAVNPMTWIRSTDYLDLDFAPSFDAFAAQRDHLLALLRSLPSEDWERAATVTGAGRPLRYTVHSYAERLARHERPHLGQLARAVDAARATAPDPPI